MVGLAATVQTFPVITRGGKSYGRMIVTCGDRQIRIIAEGDQDLIESVYQQQAAHGAGRVDGRADSFGCAVEEPDPDLLPACERLLTEVRRGNELAIDRVHAITRAAAMGDSDSFTIYCVIRGLIDAG